MNIVEVCPSVGSTRSLPSYLRGSSLWCGATTTVKGLSLKQLCERSPASKGLNMLSVKSAVSAASETVLT